MTDINVYLTIDKILDYIFKNCTDKEEKKITEYLLNNPEEREMVHGIMNICVDKKFNRKELEEYLSHMYNQPMVLYKKNTNPFYWIAAAIIIIIISALKFTYRSINTSSHLAY